MARHVARLKLGSKPAQLYVRPLGQQAYRFSRGIIRHKVVAEAAAFVLPDTRGLNSFEELCIMPAASVNSFVRLLNPHRGANGKLRFFEYVNIVVGTF